MMNDTATTTIANHLPHQENPYYRNGNVNVLPTLFESKEDLNPDNGYRYDDHHYDFASEFIETSFGSTDSFVHSDNNAMKYNESTAPLLTTYITDTFLSRMTGVAPAHFGNIKSLDLSWAAVQRRHLVHVDHLVSGHRKDEKIRRIENLRSCISLQSLNLSGQSITQLPSDPYESYYSTLQYLNLSYNQVSSISNIQQFSALVHLDVSHNQLTSLPPVSGLKNLSTLRLNNNQLASLSSIAPLSDLLSLCELTLFENPFTSIRHYRSYLIYLLPAIDVLDDEEIGENERFSAQQRWERKELHQLRSVVEHEQDELLHLRGTVESLTSQLSSCLETVKKQQAKIDHLQIECKGKDDEKLCLEQVIQQKTKKFIQLNAEFDEIKERLRLHEREEDEKEFIEDNRQNPISVDASTSTDSEELGYDLHGTINEAGGFASTILSPSTSTISSSLFTPPPRATQEPVRASINPLNDSKIRSSHMTPWSTTVLSANRRTLSQSSEIPSRIPFSEIKRTSQTASIHYTPAPTTTNQTSGHWSTTYPHSINNVSSNSTAFRARLAILRSIADGLSRWIEVHLDEKEQIDENQFEKSRQFELTQVKYALKKLDQRSQSRKQRLSYRRIREAQRYQLKKEALENFNRELDVSGHKPDLSNHDMDELADIKLRIKQLELQLKFDESEEERREINKLIREYTLRKEHLESSLNKQQNLHKEIEDVKASLQVEATKDTTEDAADAKEEMEDHRERENLVERQLFLETEVLYDGELKEFVEGRITSILAECQQIEDFLEDHDSISTNEIGEEISMQSILDEFQRYAIDLELAKSNSSQPQFEPPRHENTSSIRNAHSEEPRKEALDPPNQLKNTNAIPPTPAELSMANSIQDEEIRQQIAKCQSELNDIETTLKSKAKLLVELERDEEEITEKINQLRRVETELHQSLEDVAHHIQDRELEASHREQLLTDLNREYDTKDDLCQDLDRKCQSKLAEVEELQERLLDYRKAEEEALVRLKECQEEEKDLMEELKQVQEIIKKKSSILGNLSPLNSIPDRLDDISKNSISNLESRHNQGTLQPSGIISKVDVADANPNRFDKSCQCQFDDSNIEAKTHQLELSHHSQKFEHDIEQLKYTITELRFTHKKSTDELNQKLEHYEKLVNAKMVLGKQPEPERMVVPSEHQRLRMQQRMQIIQQCHQTEIQYYVRIIQQLNEEIQKRDDEDKELQNLQRTFEDVFHQPAASNSSLQKTKAHDPSAKIISLSLKDMAEFMSQFTLYIRSLQAQRKGLRTERKKGLHVRELQSRVLSRDELFEIVRSELYMSSSQDTVAVKLFEKSYRNGVSQYRGNLSTDPNETFNSTSPTASSLHDNTDLFTPPNVSPKLSPEFPPGTRLQNIRTTINAQLTSAINQYRDRLHSQSNFRNPTM